MGERFQKSSTIVIDLDDCAFHIYHADGGPLGGQWVIETRLSRGKLPPEVRPVPAAFVASLLDGVRTALAARGYKVVP